MIYIFFIQLFIFLTNMRNISNKLSRKIYLGDIYNLLGI